MDEMLSAEWRAREAARLRVARLGVSVSGGLRRALERAIAICAETLHVDRVGVWLTDEPASALRCVALRDHGAFAADPSPALRIADLGAYRRALDERRVIAAQDVESEPLTAPLAHAYFLPLGIRSTLDAPIYRDGSVVGVVCHEHRGEPRRWSDADADFAISVAEMIGALLAADDLRIANEALRAAESRLGDALETNSIAAIAGGVAHDLNNLLVVLSGAAQRIERNRHAPAEVAAGCGELSAAIASAARLVRHLQLWSREDAGDFEAIGVDDAIGQMSATLRALATTDRHLLVDLGAPGARACIAPASLEQVLMNLVVNAREATRSGGLIGVSTRRTSRGEARGVTIEVVDDGPGMDEATARRVFHPFFTTKGAGEHRGIGLASAKSLLDSAGAAIDVVSAPGEGSRFRIWLAEAAPESTARA
jgi:two-component system cell cycle sensor histidine kinase/response regulator CckA